MDRFCYLSMRQSVATQTLPSTKQSIAYCSYVIVLLVLSSENRVLLCCPVSSARFIIRIAGMMVWHRVTL